MKFADVCICVPETQTYKIQELHLPVYHCLCLMLEDKFLVNMEVIILAGDLEPVFVLKSRTFLNAWLL